MEGPLQLLHGAAAPQALAPLGGPLHVHVLVQDLVLLPGLRKGVAGGGLPGVGKGWSLGWVTGSHGLWGWWAGSPPQAALDLPPSEASAPAHPLPLPHSLASLLLLLLLAMPGPGLLALLLAQVPGRQEQLRLLCTAGGGAGGAPLAVSAGRPALQQATAAGAAAWVAGSMAAAHAHAALGVPPEVAVPHTGAVLPQGVLLQRARGCRGAEHGVTGHSGLAPVGCLLPLAGVAPPLDRQVTED